jgi:hypothetical protein
MVLAPNTPTHILYAMSLTCDCGRLPCDKLLFTLKDNVPAFNMRRTVTRKRQIGKQVFRDCLISIAEREVTFGGTLIRHILAPM